MRRHRASSRLLFLFQLAGRQHDHGTLPPHLGAGRGPPDIVQAVPWRVPAGADDHHHAVPMCLLHTGEPLAAKPNQCSAPTAVEDLGFSDAFLVLEPQIASFLHQKPSIMCGNKTSLLYEKHKLKCKKREGLHYSLSSFFVVFYSNKTELLTPKRSSRAPPPPHSPSHPSA